MRVLFVDMVAAKPYTANTLRSYALGGTEATVIRVARGVAALPGYEVSVFQGCDMARSELVIDGIHHVGADANPRPDVVIHLRTALYVEAFREEYPKARHIVWLHDIVTEPEPDLRQQEIVCVSEWHLNQVERAMGNTLITDEEHRFIYNPVSIEGAIRHDKVKGRLGFFSSPHKGLAQVIKLLPEGNHLVIANPGYMPDAETANANVINLGQLPHHRVLEEMSKCEALFYPQTVFPETFGLVLAEANAMGVPVLCHDFGASSEVLSDHTANAVGDCTKPEHVRLMLDILLNGNQPNPVADPRFSLENVVAEWRALLE